MQYSLNKDLQHLKEQHLKSWILPPDCLVAMDKQQTQYLQKPKYKWKMLTNYWKFQDRSGPDIWIRLPRHKWPKSWSSMEDPVVPLERNLYGHPLAGLLWEREFEKILLKDGWEKIPNWECFFVHRQKGLFLSVYVDDIKLAGKKHNDPMWKVLNKEVDLGEPTSFLGHENKGSTQRQCEAKILWTIAEPSSNRVFSREEQKNYHSLKNFVFLHGLMIWRVMQRNVWSDNVSLQTRRLNNSTKYFFHASMTTTSKKKKWNLLENCHMYVLQLFKNAYTWHEWDDLIFYGQ